MNYLNLDVWKDIVKSHYDCFLFYLFYFTDEVPIQEQIHHKEENEENTTKSDEDLKESKELESAVSEDGIVLVESEDEAENEKKIKEKSSFVRKEIKEGNSSINK